MRYGSRLRRTSGHARPRAGIVAMLGALLALAGCASGSGGTPPRAHSTAIATATATAPAELPPVSMSQAWGNVTVHALSTDLGNGQVFEFAQAATPDGQWLVGSSVPRDNPTNTSSPSFAVLYNVETHQVVTMRQLAQPGRSIYSAAADANWVVWVEGLGVQNPALINWTIYAYNRQSGQTQQVSREGNAWGPSLVYVDQGHVLWSEATGPVDYQHLSNIVVRTDDLATGAVTTLASGASGMALAWPWAVWRGLTTDASGQSQETFKNLVSGQTINWQVGAGSLALAGSSVAYDHGNAIYVLDDVTRGQAAAQMVAPYLDYSGANTQPPATNNREFVTLNNRIVAWDSDLGAQVYDRAARRLVNLPTVNPSHGYVAWAIGKTLVWQDAEPQSQQDQDSAANRLQVSTLDVIDTTTLPAQ